MKKVHRLARVAAPILTLLWFGFVALDNAGLWDRWRGIDKLEAVSARFDTSYGDISRVVRPTDPEWSRLLNLIYAYSTASIPRNREPKALVRLVAVLSGYAGDEHNPIAQWTAPSTPIILFYVDWSGQEVAADDARQVGTIGDLHTWIERDKSDFRIRVNIVLGLLANMATLFVVLRSS